METLHKKKIAFVTKEDIAVIEAREREEAKKRSTWEYKYSTDEEMLDIIAEPRAAAS
jgi:hypothetical protein